MHQNNAQILKQASAEADVYTPISIVDCVDSEIKAQVEIIPQQINGNPIMLSPEELVDAERKRHEAAKMAGCPFFAGIKKADAKAALAEHHKIIHEKRFSTGMSQADQDQIEQQVQQACSNDGLASSTDQPVLLNAEKCPHVT